MKKLNYSIEIKAKAEKVFTTPLPHESLRVASLQNISLPKATFLSFFHLTFIT